jgi:hypothetical protein
MPADTPFRVHCALEAFEKADDPDGHVMRIGGIVTTDQLDKQGERIMQRGLDFKPFLTEGWFNDNHGQKTVDVLGYPTDAFYVRKGEMLPTGKAADRNGWWAEGYLLNTEQGRKTWQLCQALTKSPRRLGFSIEGKVGKRSKKDASVITSAIVKNVAITHCPVNTGTEMTALVKALQAGSAIANPGSAPGEGFALRPESLDKRLAVEEDDEDEYTEAANLAEGDGDHPNNGGWAGLNPHRTKVRSPGEGQRVAKAEAAEEFKIVDELDLIDEWAPVLNAQLKNLQPPARLSKAESRIIVSARFPDLTSSEIDAIIHHASTHNS